MSCGRASSFSPSTAIIVVRGRRVIKIIVSFRADGFVEADIQEIEFEFEQLDELLIVDTAGNTHRMGQSLSGHRPQRWEEKPQVNPLEVREAVGELPFGRIHFEIVRNRMFCLRLYTLSIHSSRMRQSLSLLATPTTKQ